MIVRVILKLACIACVISLSGMIEPAWADTIQVTFTGNIYFTFSQEFGGPSFHGIQTGIHSPPC